jgi:hypothetical protein
MLTKEQRAQWDREWLEAVERTNAGSAGLPAAA